jgi:FkbM family methyltransferase
MNVCKSPLPYLDRLDSLRLRNRNVYEPWETGIVNARVKPGDWFIDVGAHIGYYTVMAARLVGPSGTVVAFEPGPENYEILRKNTAGLENVKTYCMAASSYAGNSDFYISRISSGGNRISPSGPGYDRVTIRTIRLDDVFKPDSYSHIRWMKVDTQGHELSVLAGANGILKTSRRISLIIEYEPCLLDLNGIRPELLLETLRGHGFTLKSSRTHDYRKCTVANGRHCNLYCVRRGG